MKIELNKNEYRALLDLVFLGDWVISAYEPLDEADEEKAIYKSTIQKIYSHAKEFGFDNLVSFSKEMDAFVETSEFEDSEIQDHIAGFEESMFWEKLIFQLAGRDAMRETGEEKMMNLPLEERIALIGKHEQKWANELEANGLERIAIKK